MVFFAFSMYRKLDGMPTCAWRSSSRAEEKWEHKLCAHFDLPSLGFFFNYRSRRLWEFHFGWEGNCWHMWVVDITSIHI
jgi:hypothetical protein